jgi:tRNA(Ile)-lysidine synthase
VAEPRRLTELGAAAGADLPSGDLVVALSGGADSAALLWLCRRLGRRVRGVHVHHGLPASDMMAGAAAAVAGAMDVDLTTQRVTVPSGPSPEAQARRVRYQALSAAARSGEWILTAHTSDDQAETVLDHLLRGAGLDGLSGIPARRFPFARPLLAVSRSTTREIATLASLPWEDDPVNRSPDPLRNRIRMRLLPELETYNRRIRESLATTARLAARDVAFLEDGLTSPVESFDGGAAVAASVLTTAHPSPAGRIIRRFLAVAGLERASPGAVEGVLGVARGETEGHQPGGGLVVRRRGALVVAETERARPVPAPIELEIGGETRFGQWTFDAYASDTPPPAMPLAAGWMVADADRLGTLRVEAAAAHPSALELLAGAGVREPDRQGHPVVVAPEGLVWIPGVRRIGIGWADATTRRYLVVRSGTERRWQT